MGDRILLAKAFASDSLAVGRHELQVFVQEHLANREAQAAAAMEIQ